jgi:hypothetical protein
LGNCRQLFFEYLFKAHEDMDTIENLFHIVTNDENALTDKNEVFANLKLIHRF